MAVKNIFKNMSTEKLDLYTKGSTKEGSKETSLSIETQLIINEAKKGSIKWSEKEPKKIYWLDDFLSKEDQLAYMEAWNEWEKFLSDKRKK